MFERNIYFRKIAPFADKPVIKVVTGMRRAGKSCLLRLIINEMKNGGIDTDSILYIDKESLDYDFISDYKDLNKYVNREFGEAAGSKSKYLFIDEIQEIRSWEKAVTSFYSKGDIDIYITGSNAHLLSSEIATRISGRYVTIPVYTLGFGEYLTFMGKAFESAADEFPNYLKYGGFPALHHFDQNAETVYQYIGSVYDTILLKDVIKRNNVRNVTLLENITRYLFDNIGNIFTSKKVSDYLKSQKMKIGIETVQNYISHLTSTYAVHKVARYDVKGKRILEFHEKYYLGDIGLRHALLGYREGDIAGILENIVFLELKRRGYTVYIGKYKDREIDFIAEKDNSKIYLQVAYLLSSKETVERELSSLLQIKDNYPKFIISLDTMLGDDFEGVKRLNLIDFLLDPALLG